MSKTSIMGGIVNGISPMLYKLLTSWFATIKKAFVNRYPFITDNLGGSFKTYLLEHDLDSLKTRLFNDLDSKSIIDVQIILSRIVNLPDYSDYILTQPQYRFFNNKSRIHDLLEIETSESRAEIKKELDNLNRITTGFKFETSVGIYCHGLTLLPNSVVDYIKNKDFIDIGSYIGDSAISFNKYEYKKIHSFDISNTSIEQYKKNMFLNGIEKEKYQINHSMVSGISGETFKIFDSGSPGLSVNRYSGKGEEIVVKSTTIDNYCDLNSVEPSLIKADMEGYAFNFVKGAIKTIVKCRPVLLIAIYHNPIELFELKPFLESKVENYTYLIRKLSEGLNRNECHSELFLIAYPSEII